MGCEEESMRGADKKESEASRIKREKARGWRLHGALEKISDQVL